MPTHIKWPSIVSFNNVRKAVAAYPNLTNGDSKVVYCSKCKLHGTNSAIQFHDGVPYAQSRTQVLGSVEDMDKGNDNAGFRRWMHKHKEALVAQAKNYQEFGAKTVTVFGEWAGPRIQKGCAINQINKPIFAVFAICESDKDFEGQISFVYEPKQLILKLEGLLDQIPEMYILPWETDEITIDWTDSVEQLQPIVDLLNKEVDRVEKCDPWVKKTFGIEGIGEGLVYYPVSPLHDSLDDFSNLAFKAKGDEHKVVKTSKAVQINPEVAASMQAFAEMVCTEARLEQGVAEACGGEYTHKKIGPFVGWVASDIKKECQDELDASSLDWKKVSKAITNQARSWYLKKIETT